MAKEDLVAMAAELGRRRQAQKRAQLPILRAKAFEDFYALGPRRSKAALLRRYKELAEAEGRQAVPTLRQETIDRWAREDNWQERALERDRELIRRAQASVTETRVQAVQQLSSLLDAAHQVVWAILEGQEPSATAATKLRAAELVFKLNGIDPSLEGTEDQELSSLPSFSLEGEELDLEEAYRRLISSP